jgi:uracil-DNA glycosylase
MLSSRQQHCLQGIGVRSWRERNHTEFDPVAALASVEPSPTAMSHDPAKATLPAFDSARTENPANTVASATNPSASTSEAQSQPEPATPGIDITSLDGWGAIESAIEACTACALAQNCTRKVPGSGNRQADLLIIGEGPGHDEDLRGEPFVGRSGQLLDRMLAAIGFSREQVFITNIVKCRPPSNRDPKPEEAQKCRAYLDAQIALLAPKLILSAGRVSAHNLLGSNLPVGKLIKQMHLLPGTDIPLKVTYHPAYLLRNPAAKAIAWQDMKLLYRMLQ